MRFYDSAVLGLLAVTLLLTPLQVSAQPAPQQVLHPLPSDAELDTLWAGRKWSELGAALTNLDSAASLTRSLDWLHSRIDAGGGLMLGLLYARDLWAIGKSRNVANPGEDMRITAGMITLYTYEMIVIDGTKCEDKSAPGHRFEQLIAARRETLAFLRQQPQNVKNNIVDIAIALEKKTAHLRRVDDLICRGGMEEYRVGLERGTQHEVPTADGRYGKTVDVTPPADWEPSFVAPAVYLPLQEKARAEMRDRLMKLIG